MAEKKKEDLGLQIVDTPQLDDPLEVLALLKDAILNKSYDKAAVAEALRQVLGQYEAKNRLFLIAAANAELPRILRLLTFLQECEEELFTPGRIDGASTKDLIKLYALAQSTTMAGLDNVKKVADMRLDIMRAAGGGDGLNSLFGDKENEINPLKDLPGLDPQSRDRVRRLVTGLVDSVLDDDSVSENDESSSDDPEDS